MKIRWILAAQAILALCFAVFMMLIAFNTHVEDAVYRSVVPAFGESLARSVTNGTLFDFDEEDCMQFEQSAGSREFVLGLLKSKSDVEVVYGLRLISDCDRLNATGEFTEEIRKLSNHNDSNVRRLVRDLVGTNAETE